MTLKVFIASSTPGRPYAEFFADELIRIGGGRIACECWWKDLQTGGFILSELLAKCNECDFAVTFFTPDDRVEKNAQHGFFRAIFNRISTAKFSPRDNCVFELGLFMGALERSPKRSFLVSAVVHDKILSDMGSVLRESLAGELVGNKPDVTAKKDLTKAAEKIALVIQEKGPCKRGGPAIVTANALMEFERPKKDGGNLIKDSWVFVRAKRPLENDLLFAGRARANMQHGIRYSYFFKWEPALLNMVGNVVYNLVSHGMPGTTDQERYDAMCADPAFAEEGLRKVARGLDILFTDNEPTMECCVHNYRATSQPQCYLKYTGDSEPYFVAWNDSQTAEILVRNWMKYTIDADKFSTDNEDQIFVSSKSYDLANNPTYRRMVNASVRSRFPQCLHNAVDAVCLG